MLELRVEPREQLGKKVKNLRKEGFLPGVVYGSKIENTPLKISYRDFEKIYKEAGESSLVKLKIGNSKEMPVLIFGVSKDPVTDKFTHVDFYQPRLDEKIQISLPVVYEGSSPVVELEEGVLIKNLHEIEVEGFPDRLPKEIIVDVSGLKAFDDVIYIKDIKVPEGIEILAEPDLAVASVASPRTQEELEALEEAPEEKVEEVEVAGKEEAEEIGEMVGGEAEGEKSAKEKVQSEK